MAVVAQERKYYSEVVTALGSFAEEAGVNANFDTVSVEGSETVAPMGIPLIWSTAADAFVRYTAAAEIAAADADGSPLPADNKVCVVVGDKRGLGFNTADVTLSATATKLTAVSRGQVGILASGIDWGAADAAAQTAFLTELETQGLVVVGENANISVQYIA